MTHDDDPPWLRSKAPAFVLTASTNEKNGPQVSLSGAAPKANPSTLSPPTTRSSENTSLNLLPSPHISAPGPSSPRAEGNEEQYAGWRPQQMTAQQIAHTPPLSPLDLAMYPGAPVISDPATARRAVAGLRPLRILSSRRPGGPASAGPSRPPSVEASNSATRSSFMGFFSAAKRASVASLAGPSSSPSRASAQSTPASHTPIPVSPLPPPRTPPLVPKLALGPDLTNQVEPALREYLEALAAQAAANPPSSSSRPISTSRPTPPALTKPAEEEEMLLEIRDLDAGRVITIRDLDAVASSDAVNRESQSKSQRPPSISEFMVVRNLDAQPRTPPPLPRPQRQRNRTPERRLLTPPRTLSPITQSPTLQVPSPRRSPTTPLTEAVYVNHNLELSLSKLENALYVARKSHSRTASNSTITSNFSSSRTHAVQTPKTAHTSSSHMSSMFSSRTLGSPLTTPPASPPPLPRLKDVALPCMVCARPMQNMTSTRCGHVFCRGCVEGRIACPICRASVEHGDLRAIYLFV